MRGYIPTSLEPAEAAAALQCVAAGGTFVPASAVIKFAQDRQNGARPSAEHETVRSSASLRGRTRSWRACGRANRTRSLRTSSQITENTVKVFVRRILMKLHASNRTEVASLTRGRANYGGAGSSGPSGHQ